MLDKKDKFRLRGLSNTIRPLVIIGKDGLTENALISIKDAIKVHELLKISLLKTYSAMSAKEFGELVCSTIDAEFINTIGRVVVIYKKNKDINKYEVK